MLAALSATAGDTSEKTQWYMARAHRRGLCPSSAQTPVLDVFSCQGSVVRAAILFLLGFLSTAETLTPDPSF